MLSTAPSLQRDYALVYSGDPALALPDDAEARTTALRVARETGQWQSLIVTGAEPTLFYVRPLAGQALTWLQGEWQRERLSEAEVYELVFRTCLARVTNLGDFKPRSVRRGELLILAPESLAELYAIGGGDVGRALVIELGSLLLQRATESISPRP